MPTCFPAIRPASLTVFAALGRETGTALVAVIGMIAGQRPRRARPAKT
jgi:hypothetical protein